ncbi:MAG: hypothetical protein AEth_00522 [Candidatus Argoarchaeum ethanivorans]|uniref:Uncharacterized protein n=1 Tax=Candidatus Argoarchaeum ethanivorans TaxID=2608793 RepID=A0A8B3S2L0_9EURY|nr:MAG: hypothetical protein AEth_00522 [Candidatus Argoarchaeum ethanivorans]
MLVAFELSLISIMLAVRTTNPLDIDIKYILTVFYIVVILMSILALYIIYHTVKMVPKMETWRDIRSKIIYGTMTDSNEIRERCEEAGVFRQKPENKIVRFI